MERDPERAYQPVDGMARTVHSDLASMLIGGVASLLLQLLHPEVMAGVDQHSRYREDPLGRLQRTAAFVGTTTFGSREDAKRAISRVRALHAEVRGITEEGVAYRATDEALLRWVHDTEIAMFLEASRRFGPRNISDDDADRYVDEMARVARDLGISDPPRTVASLWADIDDVKPHLALTRAGRVTRDFVVRGIARRPRDVAVYRTISAAAIGTIPQWARDLLEFPTVPGVDALLVRPAALALCSTLRLAVPASR